MTTVDDLTISLRIDETSNLGKLQKQLTALVGPKGDKPIGLGAGMDLNLKRDISIIKTKLEYITHIAPGIDPKKLALTASALYTRFKDPQMSKNILGKLGQNEEWLRDIQEILTGIATGTTEMKAPKILALVTLLEKASTQSTAAIGDVKKLVTDITEAVEEFIRQKQLQEIFKDFGKSVREYYIAMSKPPGEIKEILEDDKGLQGFIEAQKEAVGEEKITELVNMIRELKDPISVLSKFKDVDILEFTKLPDKLKPLAAAYIEVMKTEQIQVIDLMREYFQKIKKGSSGLTQKLESSSLDFLMTIDVWEQILKEFKGEGLKFLGGKDVPETAKYVGLELEKGTTAGYIREMRERLRKFDHTIMLFLKTNQNLDKHIDSLDKTAEAEKNTFGAFEVDIRKMRERVGKALTPEGMEKLHEEAKEEFQRIFDEKMEKEEEKNPIEKMKEIGKEYFEEVIKTKDADYIRTVSHTLLEGIGEFFTDLADKKDIVDMIRGKIDPNEVKGEKDPSEGGSN